MRKTIGGYFWWIGMTANKLRGKYANASYSHIHRSFGNSHVFVSTSDCLHTCMHTLPPSAEAYICTYIHTYIPTALNRSIFRHVHMLMCAYTMPVHVQKRGSAKLRDGVTTRFCSTSDNRPARWNIPHASPWLPSCDSDSTK